MGETTDQSAAIEKAANIVRYALATGDTTHHTEQVHAQISQRAASILSEHPKNTLSQAQTEAIYEIMASAILIVSLSSKPQDRWMYRAWRELKRQSPWQQIASILQLIAVLAACAGAASASWAYTPGLLKAGAHWLIDTPTTTPKP